MFLRQVNSGAVGAAVIGGCVGSGIAAWVSFASLERQIEEDTKAAVRQVRSDVAGDFRLDRQARFLAFSNAAENVIAAEEATYRAAWDCHSKKVGQFRGGALSPVEKYTKDQVQGMVGRSAITCLPSTTSTYAKALDSLAVQADALSQVSEPSLLKNANAFVRTLPTLTQVQQSFLQAARYRYDRDKELARLKDGTDEVHPDYRLLGLERGFMG